MANIGQNLEPSVRHGFLDQGSIGLYGPHSVRASSDQQNRHLDGGAELFRAVTLRERKVYPLHEGSWIRRSNYVSLELADLGRGLRPKQGLDASAKTIPAAR